MRYNITIFVNDQNLSKVYGADPLINECKTVSSTDMVMLPPVFGRDEGEVIFRIYVIKFFLIQSRDLDQDLH